MRKLFSGYYQLSGEEYQELWDKCTFVLDTNVLLDLYRYSAATRNDLLKILKKIKGRLWIPYHVALEYQENRPGVIRDQVKRYGEVRVIIGKLQSSMEKELKKLQLRERHGQIDPDRLIQGVGNVCKMFLGSLDDLEEKETDVHEKDLIRDKLDLLFDERIGPKPGSQIVIDSWIEEAEVRFDSQRPPGYLDRSDSQSGNRGPYSYGGLTYERGYGDFILWKQLLNQAKKDGWQHVIFVTDDRKKDWWWKVGGKTIGPRPELIDEIQEKGEVSLFHMYNPERFMTFAEKMLSIDVDESSIRQVRELATHDREIRSQNSRNQSLARDHAENAFLNWLEEISTDAVVRADFPDFITHDLKTGFRVGYALTYASRLNTRYLRAMLSKGVNALQEGVIDYFKIVIMTDSQGFLNNVDENLRLSSFSVRAPAEILVGVLNSDSIHPGEARFSLRASYNIQESDD